MQAARENRSAIHLDPTFDPNYVRGVVAQLVRLRAFLAPDAVVMLTGCLAGQGSDGVRLMRELAGPQAFNTHVVAFTTVTTELGDQRRPGAMCSEPGTRVTNDSSPSLPGHIRDHSGENLPWARINAPHSRTAHPGGWVWDQDAHDNIRPGQFHVPERTPVAPPPTPAPTGPMVWPFAPRRRRHRSH
ncbi:hypothetical protein SUDANB95_01899 [Actinosynnema sp. ALI-1.44]